MNKNVIMIMGGALVVAIIVAMLVQMKLAPKNSGDPVESGIEILVAKKTLLTGEAIRPEDVTWESWPEKSVYSGMIKKKDQPESGELSVYNKPLKRDVERGEPITMQSIVEDITGGAGFLAATIAPGMRAVGIPVKAETAAGGFVAPGDYVDVILTYQVNIDGEAEDYAPALVQKYASETIISNAKVLAVDQNSKVNGREAKVGRTVTLEVSKEDAQVLALGSMMGQMTLSLRRLGEKDTKTDKLTPLTTDARSSYVIGKIYDLMDRSKTTASTVRVYSGSEVQNVPVRTTGP